VVCRPCFSPLSFDDPLALDRGLGKIGFPSFVGLSFVGFQPRICFFSDVSPSFQGTPQWITVGPLGGVFPLRHPPFLIYFSFWYLRRDAPDFPSFPPFTGCIGWRVMALLFVCIFFFLHSRLRRDDAKRSPSLRRGIEPHAGCWIFSLRGATGKHAFVFYPLRTHTVGASAAPI